ncbi:MAG TPA: hypothetical protein ENJ82_15920, partial [Bacteroidetes bacterium]|nr:hypothetical protein [Bacteroidota bacterium]
MNGKYLLKLIHSLTGQEFDHVRRSVGNVEEGVIYSKILVQIREKGQFDRKQLSGLFGVSETSMSRLIPKVSRATILALGTFQADQELKLDIALNSAWKMVFKTENEIASRIIHDIYEK